MYWQGIKARCQCWRRYDHMATCQQVSGTISCQTKRRLGNQNQIVERGAEENGDARERSSNVDSGNGMLVAERTGYAY